ncbi:MAG: DUF342 domain-containing protein [Phycisphaeraceae bacterium]
MDDQTLLRNRVSDDGMTAWLIMPAAFDRSQLNASLCDASLQAGGVELTAATKQLVEAFLAEALHAPADQDFEAIVAQGTAPRHGQDGYVEWLIDCDDGEDAQPDPPADTQAGDRDDSAQQAVCFYDRSVYTIVTVGQRLAKLHHPTYGEDGRDVRGKTLAARDGRAIELKHDESILIGRGDEALAQASGVLDRSGSTICIRDTIEVDQYVDFSTGNIRFNGSVLVHKGVRDCFEVQADKDIEVRGLIEAATIIAGGDLRSLGGFAGREQGVARIAGDLHAKYLDAVTVYTRGDLCVEREIINCDTTVLGRIASPTGALIGGETRVAGRVEVNEIGADGLPRTIVHLGSVPHLDPLIDELADVTATLIAERHKLVDEQELIQKTAGGRPLAQHKERLCELMYEIAEVQTQLDRAEPTLARVRAKADRMRMVDVTVHMVLYPKTEFVCGGVRYKIKEQLPGPLRITTDSKGKLQIEHRGRDATMLSRNAELSEAA